MSALTLGYQVNRLQVERVGHRNSRLSRQGELTAQVRAEEFIQYLLAAGFAKGSTYGQSPNLCVPPRNVGTSVKC